MHKLIKENMPLLSDICRRHFVRKLYVFGSIASENFRAESDIDFLYEIDTDKFKDWATGDYDYTDNIFSLEKELTHLFNRTVDLVPNINIQNKYLKKTINQTKQVVYAG